MCTCLVQSNDNDLYQASHAHEQKTNGLQWTRSMGTMTNNNNNKKQLSWVVYTKRFEPSRLSLIFNELLRCLDVEIWQFCGDNNRRQTKLITLPLAHTTSNPFVRHHCYDSCIASLFYPECMA